jgi:glycosyltransferase involved in cell wall biosynthesis
VVERRGAVSRLLVPGGGAAERALVEKRFPYRRYDLDALVSSSRARSLRANAALAVGLWRHRRGLLHFHSPFVYGAARPMLMATGYLRVLHVHLDFSAEQLRWPLELTPDLILMCARSIRPQVEAALSPQAAARTQLQVIQNAVDMNQFRRADRAAAKAGFGLDPQAPLAVIIANLAPHKGQETAIRAVAQVARQHPGIQLWVVGQDRGQKGHYLADLQAMCGELGVVEKVQFLGFRSDIPEILRAADFLLLPSTSEAFPLVILEAQASGAVVIAAPTADIPDVVVDGTTGYIVPAGDFGTYAARMNQLIMEPGLAARLADNAHDRVRQYHQIGNYCETVLDACDRLAGSRGRQ